MYTASLLFGISASLDALLVGISYGIRGIRIRFWQNMIISVITLLGTCLSVGLGHRLAAFLPQGVSSCAGSLILILLGLYVIIKWMIPLLKGRSQKPPTPQPQTALHASENNAGTYTPNLKLPEVFTLSLTLTLNNLSAGLSASLAGLALFPTAVATIVCSVLFLYSGNRLGDNPMLRLAGNAADPLSGILLIGLGLVQFFL
ncbi:manganese efflux pump [Acetatifactor muris]|uniref:Manganese efflux pump MntP n=1 Tax=Acetatifactor muris TaxID=879566 RepID=A0A2K4ZE69_9FIRM|nr:manganese efflux pump [Acetatifactor muris]MCI8800966.1 hypothetical protein [Lachnospiraceae bacterium]MCR2047156.1 manganese efflux pump [Acetatifactor muris]SOY28765.1 manganese efflux pump MntP [Acetatifactor muris]